MQGKALNVKSMISLFILIAINLLFYAKYLERVTDYYLLFSVIFSLIFTSVLFLPFLLKKELPQLKFVNIFLILVLIAASFYISYKIPIETINVDRWEIITLFWNAYEKGDYVYFAQMESGNKPGAMPFYFLISYPFYLTKSFFLMPVIALIIFVFTLRYAGIKSNGITTCIIFLLLSPSFLWEISTRSTLYLNSALVFFSIVYFFKEDKLTTKRLIIAGVLIGLFLSIRFVFIIVYIIVFMYALRTKIASFKQLVGLGIVALISMLITYVPFIYNHLDVFISDNPFFFQSTWFVPFYYTILFVLLAFIFSFIARTLNDIYFYCGLTLFISMSIYFIYYVYKWDFNEAFFERSYIDISYFIFGFLFSLYYYIANLQEYHSKSLKLNQHL